MPTVLRRKGMRKLLKSLPTIRFMMITVIVCLVLGVIIVGGFHPKALFGLVFAVLFVAMVTLKNSDPMAWEAIHEPRSHSLRLQCDTVANQLQAVVDAYESGDPALVTEQTAQARKLLADLRTPTTAR